MSGKSDVRLDGEKVAELADGQFVGRIAYITGEKVPVSIAKGSTRIISWSCVKLETFFKDRPDVELQLAIASARISHGCLNPPGNRRIRSASVAWPPRRPWLERAKARGGSDES